MHPNVRTPPAESSGVDTDPQKSVHVDHIASNMMRMGSMMLDANSRLLSDENVNAIEDTRKPLEFAESAAAAT